MKTNLPPRTLMLAALLLAMCGISVDQVAAANGEEATDVFIRRVISHTSRPDVRVRAVREMQAGTLSGKHRGWMEVETEISGDGFTWRVLDEGGSERTRNKIFRELLKAEADSWRDGSTDDAALTLSNYRFEPVAANGNYRQFRLKPRREDPKLIDGILTVSADGFPVKLEGRLAKSPSFWVKSVTVVRRYGRFAGVSLPTSMESLADVKLFGQSTMTMRYRYAEVNGQSIPQAVASASPGFGPSAELRALHASGAGR